jgi:osmotically inducible protein OsmC
MPIARREAEVAWEGTLARGTGTLTSGSGALDRLAVTWAELEAPASAAPAHA